MKKIFCECGSKTAQAGNYISKVLIWGCVVFTIYNICLYLV